MHRRVAVVGSEFIQLYSALCCGERTEGPLVSCRVPSVEIFHCKFKLWRDYISGIELVNALR